MEGKWLKPLVVETKIYEIVNLGAPRPNFQIPGGFPDAIHDILEEKKRH